MHTLWWRMTPVWCWFLRYRQTQRQTSGAPKNDTQFFTLTMTMTLAQSSYKHFVALFYEKSHFQPVSGQDRINQPIDRSQTWAKRTGRVCRINTNLEENRNILDVNIHHVYLNTETEMSSFDQISIIGCTGSYQNDNSIAASDDFLGLNWKLSKWQILVQSVTKFR